MRASGKDDAIVLTTPVKFTLEQAIEFIDDDELVEVTPESIRIRKKLLTENDRKTCKPYDNQYEYSLIKNVRKFDRTFKQTKGEHHVRLFIS